MLVSLEEAATRLGKTPRQVRYMVRQGTLKAQKIANRWMIERDALLLSAPAAQAEQRDAASLHRAVERGLLGAGSGASGHSVHSLRAFRLALPVHAAVRAGLGVEHAATGALEWCLRLLARGCHRFHPPDKVAAYAEARDAASDAVLALILASHPDGAAWVRSLEFDVLPAISSLVGRFERSRSPT